MKTHESRTCLMFAYSNYHHTSITIMLHLPSFTSLKEQLECMQTYCSYCLPFATPTNFLQMLPNVYKTYKPLVVVTYHLKGMQTSYSCCIMFKTSICLLLQPLNLVATFMMLPFNGSYLHVITLPSYASSKYKQCFHYKK